MNILLNVFRTLFLSGLLFAFHGCKNQNVKDFKVDPAFREHITSFTSGIISAASPITINLAHSYKGEFAVNEEFKDDLFKITPSIKGKTVWLDAYTVQFIPSENLKSGTDYWVTFDLKKVADVENKLKTFKFPITTIKQAINFEIDGLKNYSNEHPELYQFSGVAYTADVIASETLSESFKVTVNGKSKKIKWEKEHQNAYRLLIDSLRRNDSSGEIVIVWNKKPGQKKEDATLTQSIPARNEFVVINTKVVQHPEQHVVIQFSDPLQPRQNLDGLIEIQGENVSLSSVSTNELSVYPYRQIVGIKNLHINRAIQNYNGKELGNNAVFDVVFEAVKPNVRFVGKGNILPSSNNMLVPFEAVNLKAVDVRIIKIFENNIVQFFQNNTYDGNSDLKRVGRVIRKKTIDLAEGNPIDLGKWNRFNLDISKYIEIEQGAIYRIEIGFRKYQSVYTCNDYESEDIIMDEKDWDEYDYADNEKWEYINDWSYNYYDYEWFDGYSYYKRENPCSYSYYRDKSVAKNIFASDIGIIVKKGSNNEDFVVVSNILTAEPIQNAKITFYDYQQQVITTERTDKDGIVKASSLQGTPFFIVAEFKKQKSYLRLGSGNSLSMSHFDIDGASTQKGMKGYIYGERGVWRPGDTLFLNFMLEDKEKLIPQNHPVIFELFNSRGQLVERKVKTKSVNGIYNFTTPTSEDAPTGNWLAKVEVGGAEFSKSVKVETIKPNRLKINLQLKNKLVGISQPYIEGDLSVNWLHGAPARELKTDIYIDLIPAKTAFKEFEKYVFDDPTKTFYSSSELFLEKNLDNEGKLSFKEKLEIGEESPGMLKVVFTTRTFEKGGDFSIDQKAINYAPYETFVGIKMPEINRYGSLETDTNYRFSVASLNQNGKIVKNRRLEIEIYRMDWNWWWESSNSNYGNYISRSNVTLVQTDLIYTNTRGEGNFDFKVDKYDWGPYLIKVTDVESGHSTGITPYFDWPSWMSRSGRENPAGATMLSFATDKKEYSTGEKAKITFPSSEGSRALISIESGTKVIDAFWIEAQGGETAFELPITPDLSPNCYVNITLLQPHKQTINDAPIRMYGVVPILVKDPNTVLEPEIKMPDELSPNSTFTIEVKERNNRNMSYTIAVVDEGLLDLTGFKTPNPWKHFYAREALGVKTWDLFDYVIGAYGAKVENLLTIGGDENINPGEESPIRFKPMVRFIGPFSLEGGQTAKHEIDVPNYIGSVRTMLVAGQDGAYGNTEKTTPVKKPLMLLSTLPRVLSPNEKVQLPVNIFVMDEKVKQVNVQIKTNALFKINGEKQKVVRFDRVGDKVVNFELETSTLTGAAKVEITAASGGEKYTEVIDLEVRQPNLPITIYNEGVLDAKQDWETEINLPGIENSNIAILELSAIPPINLEKRLGYLIRYPHGCLEQITSGAFPQLYLSSLIEIDDASKAKIESNILSVINKIQRRQLTDGGFAFWEGDRIADDWATSYAGHFILEAEKKGYALPYNLKKKWIDYQTKQAKNWRNANNNNYRNYDLPQAYRLYTLALAGKPVLSAMNKLRAEKSLSVQSAWRLAAAYQIIGKSEVAKEIVQNLTTKVINYTELGYTYGNQYRDQAMIIETLTLMGDRNKAVSLVRDLSETLSSDNWMSTQTTAYALMSIALFADNDVAKNEINSSYIYNGKTIVVNSKKAVELIDLPISATQKTVSLKVENNGNGTLFARVITTGIPPVGNEYEYQRNINFEVVYRDLENNIIAVDKIEQGTDFYAEVTVSNPGMRGDYKQLALSQLFPSGWEIRNQRMSIIYDGNEDNELSYQDIRDDRVYSYFDLYRNQSKTIRIQLHAAYVGEYYLPSAHIEAMYDNSIAALIKGKIVSVIGR